MSTNKAKEREGPEPEKRKRAKRSDARQPRLATYDCGGAIHIRFSTKRDAINIIYKHNPIHRDVEDDPANGEK
jgi:hypothetical protein